MKQNRDRNGGVTDENQPRHDATGGRKTGCQFFIIQSEGLKETRRSVAQMERKQEHPEDIKTRYENVLKAVDHHGIDIVSVERIRLEEQESGISDSGGEMREV